MAVPFYAHIFAFSPISEPVTRATFNPSKCRNLALPLRHGKNGNSLSSFRTLREPQHSRLSYIAAYNDAATDPMIIKESVEKQAMENTFKSLTEPNVNMKALIQAYKKAYLLGDENLISEVEASICIIEKEKIELSSKSTNLISEITSAKNNFLQLNADFENSRKRSELDYLTFTFNNSAEVIESLLSIVDKFERVKHQMRVETERERMMEASYQGIYRQLVEIMRCMHVSVVETIGKPYDPSIHEAVSREKSQQFKPGIVTEEICRGFVLGGRVLRQASVKVSTGPG